MESGKVVSISAVARKASRS